MQEGTKKWLTYFFVRITETQGIVKNTKNVKVAKYCVFANYPLENLLTFRKFCTFALGFKDGQYMRKINRAIDEKYKSCPIRNVIEKFGDKWSLLVLYHLNERGTMRFNDLGRDMSDCSQKMLSQTLKRLEQIDLVARHVYPEVPPRVEYSITELGKSLMPHVIALMEWATQNFENIVRNEGNI